MQLSALIDAAAAQAESAAAAGRCRDALNCYLELLCNLFTDESGALRIDATSAWLIERISELAVVVGHTAPAAKLLNGLHLELISSCNRYMADLIALKRLQLAVMMADWACIAEILQYLRDTVGDFEAIEFKSTAALERLERSCNWPDVRRHERAIFFAEFYHASARLFEWLGQCGDAEAALQRGLTHATTLANDQERLRSGMQVDLVGIALLRGDLPTARERLSGLASTTDPIGIVRRAELSAGAAVLAGEFAAAEASLRKARTVCASHELSAAAVMTDLHLGYLLLTLNRTAEIDALVDEAQPVAAQLGAVRLTERLERLRALSRARRTSSAAAFLSCAPTSQLWGDEPEAPDAAQAGNAATTAPIELPTDSGASLLDRLSDYTLGLYQCFQQRDVSAADHWYEHMRQVFSCSDSPLVRCRLRLYGAMTRYYRSDYREAAAQLDPLLEDLRRLGLRHDLWLACCFRFWCYARLGEQGQARSASAAEARTLVDVMGQGLSAAARATFELNKWNEDEADLAARIDELIQELASARRRWWPARWVGRLRLYARLEELIARLDARRAAALHTRGHAATRRPWWSRVLRWRRRMTLSFLVLPDRVFVVREGFLRLDFMLIALTRLELRELVSDWHESMLEWHVAVEQTHRSQEERCAARVAETSAQLSAALLLPQLLEVGSARHLRIVPDDSLHGAPFAALSFQGRRLAERFALSLDVQHVPAPELRRFHRRPRKALVAAMGLPLARPELPYADDEAAHVASALRRRGFEVVGPLLGNCATPQAVTAGLLESTAAHVVCHGQFSADSMEQTGLCLFGAETHTLLSLMDLARLDLSALELIALSSCWSADNYVLPGRTVISLPQMIRSSGAQAVLSCLWKIDDEVGATFIKRFYQLTETVPELQALQRTQAEFVQGKFTMQGGLSTSEPFYWAGYTLHCAG